MESLNLVVLAGKVHGLPPQQNQTARSFKFTLATNQMYFDAGSKMMDQELHEIKLLNHKTISGYIKPGKHMVISGRLKHGRDGSYVLADKIHFPGDVNE